MHYVYVLRSVQRSRILYWLLRKFTKAIRAAFARRVIRDLVPWTLEADLLRNLSGQADALGREKYLKSGDGRKFLRTQLRHYLSQEPLS